MINPKPWALALILGLSFVTVACGGEKEQNVEDSTPSGVQTESDDNEAQPGQAADQAEDEDQNGDDDDQDSDQAEDQDGDDD